MSEEIRNRIDEAGNKEKLEAIGRELTPPLELDRRKNMDILRAELHAHLDEHEGEPEPQEAGDEQGGDTTEPDPAATAEPGEAGPSDHDSDLKYQGRLLQNTRTKVFYPYTAALAKKRNMREV